ncbi:rod-binding protein [Methylobacterium sp. J-078]|uniref:rod-binding protein n=1 Tax=Methylobacterium sp. J-078 TaxID=2836657 RepID=UPI001FBA64CC|nr:rod-binding protein [Methylobacterium sp. J-078]MCJ2043910.1 rod-binding protein [Methylobacterium sp. J-078]
MLFAPLAASAALGVGKAIVGDIAKSVQGAVGSATASTAKTAAEAKARKASTDFESMFLEQSLDRLAQSEGTDGPLGENGTGGGVYRSMLTKEYAAQIVKSGGVGIADGVFREMMKMQEGTGAATN